MRWLALNPQQAEQLFSAAPEQQHVASHVRRRQRRKLRPPVFEQQQKVERGQRWGLRCRVRL